MSTVGDMWIICCFLHLVQRCLRLASVCHAPVLDVACYTCCCVIFIYAVWRNVDSDMHIYIYS